MTAMNPTLIKHNIKKLPKEKELLDIRKNHFGRYIEIARTLKAWVEDPATQSTHVSQKRKTLAQALKEFRDLYGAKEYYAMFGKNDDSFKVYYRQ